jgi:predicted dehydrogenase
MSVTTGSTVVSTPLRIGIIGTGQRCMFFFAPYIAAHPSAARLVALADQEASRLRSAVADLGGAVRAYPDMDTLLQDTEIDAVIITTPDYTHRHMLDKALDAGKHVLCEKPMATTLEDALHMTRRALATPQTVQIGFMLRFAPFFVQLKALLEAGTIGRLLQVSAVEVVEYYHGASFFRRWHRWRRHSGGLLVHKACHTLDVINWLVGAVPEWVSARGSTSTFVPNPHAASHCQACSLTPTCAAAYDRERYNYTYLPRQESAPAGALAVDLCVYNAEKDSVDNAALVAQYANGVGLTFTFSTTGQRHERHLLLLGERGLIRASQAEGTITVEPYGAASHATVLPEELRDEHGGGDTPLMEEFLACVTTGKRPTADVLAGLYSVALATAATQSIDRGGEAIDLRPLFSTFTQ